MEITRISAKELVSFAETAQHEFDNAIPITLSRARAQAANPRVKPDSVLLVIARQKRQLLGFIGILPGIISANNEKPLFWNTGGWVKPGSGAAVSMSLFA